MKNNNIITSISILLTTITLTACGSSDSSSKAPNSLNDQLPTQTTIKAIPLDDGVKIPNSLKQN